MKDADVTIQQVKRHKNKPTVEISLDLVKELIKKAKVKVECCAAYHLYTCGHVLNKEDDERVTKYMPDPEGHSRAVRICPICWEASGIKEQLLTKYKLCSCGAEHVGKKIQPSNCCADCSASRKAIKGKTPLHEIHANEDHADPSRCFCIHRQECIKEYAKYECIPCKDCPRFEEKEGVWY